MTASMLRAHRPRDRRSPVGRLAACVVMAAVVVSLLPLAAFAAPKPSVTVSDVFVSESAGTASFRIRVSPRPRSCCPLTVDWSTADATAVAPSDYAASSGTVTLSRSTSSVLVTVPIAQDAIDEATETFTVNLSNLVGTPGKIGDGQAVGTITDDDATPTLSIDDVVVGEGESGTTPATFTVSLSAPSGRSVSVDWASADGTATHPTDYTAGSGTATFPPGDTSEPVSVTVKGDTDLELDETFTVGLTNPVNATVSDASGTGTIVADEVEPVVSIANAAVTEGDSGPTTLTFTVSLSRPGLSTATLDWATSDATAAAPGDYTGTSGTVTFLAGDVSETVDVTVHGDTQFELDEILAVDLSNLSNCFMGDGHADGTISNDDLAPTVSIDDVSAVEGNTGTTTALFDVTLSASSGVASEVSWATADLTATAGSDYVADSGLVTFAPGDVSKAVSVIINGDTTHEPNEAFTVTLSGPSGAVIADGSGRGRIVNDDKFPTTLTLRVQRRPLRVVGSGRLEPAKVGFKVTVSLFRKRANGSFLRLRATTAVVKNLRDRDGDGLNEGTFLARFARPHRAGTYRMVGRFRGTASHRRSVKRVTFSLP